MPFARVSLSPTQYRAYIDSLAVQRRRAAEYYRDNPHLNQAQAAKICHVSTATLQRALAENNIVVPLRKRGGSYLFNYCPKCQKQYRHYCKGPTMKRAKRQVTRVDHSHTAPQKPESLSLVTMRKRLRLDQTAPAEPLAKQQSNAAAAAAAPAAPSKKHKKLTKSRT
jgi:hypothetical protein